MKQQTHKLTIDISITEPYRPCKCESNNTLRLAGEYLLKLASGDYGPDQEEGAWEVIEALLKRRAGRSRP